MEKLSPKLLKTEHGDRLKRFWFLRKRTNEKQALELDVPMKMKMLSINQRAWVVHPGPHNKTRSSTPDLSLAEIAQWRANAQIVHRLDKETSGVMIVA